MSKRKTNVRDELLLNKVVLRPDRTHSRPPESIGRVFEVFTARSEYNGQAISGWYFPTGQPGAVALVSSSNRGTKAEALEHAAMLLECGCSVLLYDYQGFGDSEGLADVRTLVGDAGGVLEWARKRLTADNLTIWQSDSVKQQQQGTAGNSGRGETATAGGSRGGAEAPVRLVMVGLSLGSLVAIRLAAGNQAVHGLVLDGAVEPFRALRRSFGPLGAVIAEVACSQVPDDLNSEKHIQSVTCPTLFIHGRRDDISTIEDAEHLASRARHANLWVLEDCGHLDIIARHSDEYRRRVEPLVAGPVVR